MDRILPEFRYHPDPIATGSVKPSGEDCRCCGLARGYIYTSSVYAQDSLREQLCPWCIADGSAATKFDAMFSDAHTLIEEGVPDKVVEEVTRRTPGYDSWQQEVWLACCGDACEFHGDVSRAELQALSGNILDKILAEWEWSSSEWAEFIKHYQPGGDPAVYKFVCRHCEQPQYSLDFT